MTYVLTIAFHTGKTMTVRASEFHCLENGVVHYFRADGMGFEKFYPSDGILTKVEISFDN